MKPPAERLRVSTYSRAPSATERTFYKRFIDRMIELREEAGLTIEQLEDQMGVAAGAVAKWETYQRLPGAFMLMCWCQSLGTTLSVIAIEIEDAQE